MGILSDVHLLPWHQPCWVNLLAYIEAERLPHALLITGNEGLGKTILARCFAKWLLCEHMGNSRTACGRCKSCHLMKAQSHPDFIFIEADKPGNSILVDQIRDVIERLSLSSHYSGSRVVILQSAHRLNTAAANSLLKTLEEPTAGTVFILVTNMPSVLPLTIVSRCQRLEVPLPDRDVAVKWLREQQLSENPEIILGMARGAPVKALMLAKQDAVKKRNFLYQLLFQTTEHNSDPVSVTAKCSDIPEQWIIELITDWVIDMIRLGNHPEINNLANPDLRDTLQRKAQRLNLVQLFSFLDLLLKAKEKLFTQANKQLLVEEIMIEWQMLATRT